MKEKEERIYIGKINWQEPLGFFPVPMGKCNSFCEDCQGGMTHHEAIRKISSHLLMCDISTMDTDEIAEAALNALLEE